MKIAEIKTLAATMFVAVIVSTSAYAAETTGLAGNVYDASMTFVTASNNAGSTGTTEGNASAKLNQTLTVSSDASLDAEMQSELYAEQMLQQYNAQLAAQAAASQVVTQVGNIVTDESTHYVRGAHVGNFKLTGYYGAGTTYSGAYTQANHTIAADTSLLPLGTKVFINNTVYTVEDIGSAVKGYIIDVYFNTKAEAAGVTDKGWQYADVYIALPA